MKILLLLSMMVSTSLLAEEIPGEVLLKYFSSNCRTQGEWTRAAISDSLALIETLKSIAQDPDCKNISGAITDLSLLNQELQVIQNTNSTKNQIASFDAQEQELLIQLSKNTDAQIISKLPDLIGVEGTYFLQLD
ncbi:MAG: hypothetical protein AB7I27_19435 [Bacteriovoracaceae bacterium]